MVIRIQASNFEFFLLLVIMKLLTSIAFPEYVGTLIVYFFIEFKDHDVIHYVYLWVVQIITERNNTYKNENIILAIEKKLNFYER